MTSRDFNGSSRPAGGRGADDNVGGWGDDGYWREPAADSALDGMDPALTSSGAYTGPSGGPRGGGAAGRGNSPNGGYGATGTHGTRGGYGASYGRGGYGSANNGYGAGGYSSQDTVSNGYGAEGHGADGYGADGYGAEGYGADGYGAEGYGADGYGADGYGPGGHGTDGYGADGYQSAGYQADPEPRTRRGLSGLSGLAGLRATGLRGTRRRNDAGQPKVKIKGSWWRHWSLKKAFGVLGSTAAVLILIFAGLVYYAYSHTTVPTAALAANTYQQSTVYFSDGKTVVGKFGSIDRQLLPLTQIPKVMQDAAIAAEDRGFYTEGGISVTGIVRAAFKDVFSSGNSLQGGSTITQQFVRQYYSGVGTQQTMSRKIKEIFISMKISKEKSKQWILQQYLNTIYLGDGAYGVGAAAQTYFGIPVQKLDAAQAAVIAAIIQQPTNFPLPQYRNDLITRWHYVLSGMVKMGDLSATQAASMAFPKFSDAPEQSVGNEPWDPYILEQVHNELTDIYHLDDSTIDNGGLKIITTIDPKMNAALYRAVDYNEKLMREGGGSLPWYALVGAELQDPHTGAILAEYPGRGQGIANCAKYFCDLNTAAYSRNQVGSSFKPYVLMQAVKEGMNVKTSWLNGYSPLWVPLDTQPMVLSSRSKMTAPAGSHEFHNDAFENLGPLHVSNAIAMSSNTAFTDLMHRVGTRNVVHLASEMGIDTTSSGLANSIGETGMALGVNSLTVNEQDTMLSTIADNGMYHSAHLISGIVDPVAGTTTRAKVSSFQVLSPAQDSQVQYAMSFDTYTNYGTGGAADMTDGRPIIAKTGTTTNNHSAFFIGAIPQAALSVGIFTGRQGDDKETLNGLGGNAGGGFGGYWPARIWNTFMEDMYASTSIEHFQDPLFTGAPWNQVGQLPKPPKKHHHGPPPFGHHHHKHPGPGPHPTPSASSPTPPPPTCGPGQSGPCKTHSPGAAVAGQQPATAGTVSALQAGTAVGGALALLPGTLLWNRLSTRRRRRRRAASRRTGLQVRLQPADVVGQFPVRCLADDRGARGAHHVQQQGRLDRP